MWLQMLFLNLSTGKLEAYSLRLYSPSQFAVSSLLSLSVALRPMPSVLFSTVLLIFQDRDADPSTCP